MKSNMVDALSIRSFCVGGKEILDYAWLVFQNPKSSQEGVVRVIIRFNVTKLQTISEQFLVRVNLADSLPFEIINFNFLLIWIVSKYCFLIRTEFHISELFICQEHVIYEVCDSSFICQVIITSSESWSPTDFIESNYTLIMSCLIIGLLLQLLHVSLI